MEIGNKDLIWNYLATFLKIASSALLLPLILNTMPAEKVGIYIVFITITSFAALLDFGFNSSFTRNVTYVFSGVKVLKKEGVEILSNSSINIDYGLLKGLISVMKRFYLISSLILFLLLFTVGTYYIHILLQNYNEDPNEVYIAWIILIITNTYNIYTLYYGALLVGKGLVKISKQIIIIGQAIFLLFASILIIFGYGLIAIFIAQGLSVIIIRILSKKAFFNIEIKKELNQAISHSKQKIFKSIYPNSIKLGLTSLGAFLIHRTTIVIGSLFLSLELIASYGITIQVLGVISGLSGIFTATFIPKISELRVKNDNNSIKNIYLKGQVILILTYIIGGFLFVSLGDIIINLISNDTSLLARPIILLLLVISFLENNHAIAGGILLTKNEVPFFKASIFSGFLTVLFLYYFLGFTNLEIWALVLSPGLAQIIYQNWKWPLVVSRDLNITKKDIFLAFKNFNFRDDVMNLK